MPEAVSSKSKVSGIRSGWSQRAFISFTPLTCVTRPSGATTTSSGAPAMALSRPCITLASADADLRESTRVASSPAVTTDIQSNVMVQRAPPSAVTRSTVQVISPSKSVSVDCSRLRSPRVTSTLCCSLVTKAKRDVWPSVQWGARSTSASSSAAQAAGVNDAAAASSAARSSRGRAVRFFMRARGWVGISCTARRSVLGRVAAASAGGRCASRWRCGSSPPPRWLAQGSPRPPGWTRASA